jgi:hypothetical protein
MRSIRFYDYALDLKNFHESSQGLLVAPVLIATEAKDARPWSQTTPRNDRLLVPSATTSNCSARSFGTCSRRRRRAEINVEQWEARAVLPTPTIIEAAVPCTAVTPSLKSPAAMPRDQS